MPIRFQCLSCGKSLKADESKAGKRVKCPGCDDIVTIPEPEAEVEDFDNFGSYGDDEGGSQDNLYAPPKSDRPKRSRASRASGRKLEFADPGKRFLGAILDMLCLLLFVVPGIVCFVFLATQTDPNNNEPSVGLLIAGVIMVLLGLAIFFALNLYLFATRSQSLAKYLLKMQILDYETKEPAGFVKSFVLRSFVNGLIAGIPTVGNIYGLVDVLFIFSEEHRCLHDHLAGTCVVNIS